MSLALLLLAVVAVGAYCLGLLAVRFTVGAGRFAAVLAALLVAGAVTATAGWAAWPSYLTPFFALGGAVGSLLGAGRGLLGRGSAGRYAQVPGRR
ncbi:hypothetical protein RMN57_31720 [Kitasatospora sp. CM 4170]|uniref:Uncharacterized protein n=1 Tax=Kitasatospora aburaviensis TaxID=67265 RepID=A0ABW1F106_9ACTN|nr:hypothetical protein [Kitasatospora sp. CM 4170]WNM48938.1 hypothetical protein RMN57_31720 [Kitasatospora sp. CM 4170]